MTPFWDAIRAMIRILLAEDDDSMREYLARALERTGYSVTSVDRGTAARVVGFAEPENGACRLFLLFEEERGSDRPTDARQPRLVAVIELICPNANVLRR